MLAVAAMAAMVGCADLDSGSLLVSEADEVQMGAEFHSQLLAEMPAHTGDARVRQYVQAMGNRVVPHTHRPNLGYTFTVVQSDEVNAFAVMGGYVYVTTGLLKAATSGAEVAGVVAHELGHISARHGVKAMENYMLLNGLASLLGKKYYGDLVAGAIQTVTTLTFSKDQEREADDLGLQYALAAGYNAWGLVDFFEFLDQAYGGGGGGGAVGGLISDIGELFSTHPPTPERINTVSGALQDLEITREHAGLDWDTDEFLTVKALLN